MANIAGDSPIKSHASFSVFPPIFVLKASQKFIFILVNNRDTFIGLG
jgi:hypothetical protein